MNKFFAKIASLTAGLALVAGAGVALASHAEVKGVRAADVTDTITASDLAATSTQYVDFTSVSKSSSAVYAGNSAKSSAGAIQMRSKNSNSGIVSTTSGGTVKSVTITVASGSNTVDVYGSNTAYTSASQLYNTVVGTKVGSTSSTGTITFTDSYSYVGIRSNNGAIYLTSVEIVWDDGQGGGEQCEHDWEAGEVHAATCTEQGYTEYTCSICGEEKHDDIVAALGHNYGDVIVDTAATCTEAGAGHKVCSRDSSHVENVVIPATGHNFVNGVCTECGAEEPNDVTVTTSIATYASAHSWSNSTKYSTINMDSVITVEATGGSNTGKYYTSGSEWRTYQTESPSITFTAASGYSMTSITITYNISNTGVLLDANSNQISSGTAVLLSSVSSYTFGVGNSGSATNGQVKITEISVTYSSGGTPEPGTSYSVTNDIENGSLNKTSVSEGATLTATITPASKYDVPESVSVTMGGSDAEFTYSAGVVTVENVTGDIVISGECSKKHGLWPENPYTVAEARAAIDAAGSSSISEAYVSGIISQVDSYNSTYSSITYWISDDGTTTDQLQVYSGKGIGGAAFSAKEDVEVGATVKVTGTLKKYNSTYEFDKNNELVTYVAPVHEDPTVTLSSYKAHLVNGGNSIEVTADYESFSGTPTLSVEGNSHVGVSINGSTITIAPTSVGSDELTVKATYNTQEATKTFKVIVTAHAGTLADPLTVAEARDVIDVVENETSYVVGIVSQVDSYSSGQINYWISDDGTTTDQLECYKGRGFNGASFIAKDDLVVDTKVVVNGALKAYNETYEFDSNNRIVAFPNVDEFAEELLSMTDAVCYGYVDGDDNSEEIAEVFETLSGAGYYGKLTSTEVAFIKGVDAKEDGTTVEQAMARYDYLVTRYGNGFIDDRPVVPGRFSPISSTTVDSNTAIAVVAIVAIASISAIAVILVIKRRKAFDR